MATKEILFNDIPDEMKPLFEGSARQVLQSAKNMLTDRDIEGQKELLTKDLFHLAVNSALVDTDQRGETERENLIKSFDEELRPTASLYFSPPKTISY